MGTRNALAGSIARRWSSPAGLAAEPRLPSPHEWSFPTNRLCLDLRKFSIRLEISPHSTIAELDVNSVHCLNPCPDISDRPGAPQACPRIY